MALFRYRAVNAAGDVAAGELEAANEAEIVDRLRDQGLMPMNVEAALAGRTISATGPALRRSRWFESRTVTRDQVLGITRELATLLRAGLPLDRAMVMLGFVVPQFQQTFAQVGKALPLPTEIVIFLGTGLRKYWWLLLIIVVALVWVTRRRLRLPEVRLRWDGRLLRAPLLGDLLAKVEVARFARTLATLLGNGVTLLSGLAITKETMTNSVLAQALDGVVTRLREGKGFGRPLAETGVYPKLATQLILVGEESGRLEEMLNRVAEVYDREVQVAVKRFLAVLEPALILGLAVLIGGIVFSILLGVMGMNELVA